MTLDAMLRSAYAWGDAYGTILLLGMGLAFPLGATIAAWIGRGGRTDADGRFIANVVVGLSVLALVLEIIAITVAKAAYDAPLLQANAALLAAPLLCFVLSLMGIHWVFPINQLASYRTLMDLVLFTLACLGTAWFFSKFRGWGIVFFGGVGQLIVLLVLGALVMRRLFRRAFTLNK